MNVNYDYYKIFYYVASCKSFTKAADLLLSNQPNITRAMKNLESALGCTLFIRNNRGVALTPEGELLFHKVSVAVEQIQAAEEAISLSKQMDGGVVSIGATESALHGVLFDILDTFHQKYPNVRIRITNHSTPHAIRALENQLVDLAIITSPLKANDNLKFTRIKSFQDYAVVGSHYTELHNRKVSIKELSDYPIISLPKGTATYDFFSDLFSKKHIPYSIDVEGATTAEILPMVKYNLGVSFLPDFLIEEAVKNGQIMKINLAEKIPAREICLVEQKKKFISFAAKELKKLIIQSTDADLLHP